MKSQQVCESVPDELQVARPDLGSDYRCVQQRRAAAGQTPHFHTGPVGFVCVCAPTKSCMIIGFASCL